MDIVFKALNNKSYSYNVNLDDSISSVFDKLISDANLDKQTINIKIIYQGKILNPEQKFSEFTLPPNPKDKLTFVFMASKNKYISTSSTTNDTIQQSIHLQPTIVNADVSNETSPNETEEDLDETDKARASLTGLLVFIRYNPQFFELFNNNFENLIQVIMSPQFKPFFDKLLNSTNNQNLDDDNSDDDNSDDDKSDYLDDVTNSIFDMQQNNNAHSKTASLTTEDINNISTLEALGFQKQECIQAYILSNKQLDVAASMLMDM